MKIIPISKTLAWIQGLQWILDPIAYLETNRQRYGDIFAGQILFKPQTDVIVGNPEVIQYILTHDSGKRISAPGEASEQTRSLLGEYSIFLLSGEQHMRHRALLTPPFHGECLSLYDRQICKIAQEFIEQWPLNKPFEARSAMQQITMRVILQIVFGLDEGERFQQLETLIRTRMNLLTQPSLLFLLMVLFPALQELSIGSWSPGKPILELVQKIDRLIFAEIQERRSNPDPERTDILSLLVDAKDESNQGLTDQEIHDELITLLIAGHETTATSVTWALYWVHRQPDVLEQILGELATLGQGFEAITSDPMQVIKLPYLSAVCNETLRICPVGVAIPLRRVEAPIEVMGYIFQPGMILHCSNYLVHQRQDLYPHPDQFHPERFLERRFSPYEFFPFGGGVRRCIGEALAQHEMKLILASILSQCELKLLTNEPIKLKRRGSTMAPRVPVYLQKTGVKPKFDKVIVNV